MNKHISSIVLALTISWLYLGQHALMGQNLLSFPSFNFSSSREPSTEGLIQLIDNGNSWIPFNNTTTDWHRNQSGYWIGIDSCQNDVHHGTADTSSYPLFPFTIIPDHDDAYYAGLYKWSNKEGEGLQQELDSKMREGFYSFSFWYYLPCENYEYHFSVWASTKKNKGGIKEKVATLQLPKDTLHQWKKFETTLELTTPFKRFDWFLLLFEGTSSDPMQPDDGSALREAYVFLDDFNLERLPCTGCVPHGDIAINALYIEHFSPGVTPGYNDEFVFGPVYNATDIELIVEDVRNEVVVYESRFRNPRGFFGTFVTWDGLTNTGGTNGVPAVNGFYAAKVTATNCDHEVEIVYPINICDSAICQPEPVSHPLAQSYEIPEWNRPPFPFGMDNLVVTGRYNRSEFFRSCGSIIVGDSINLALDGFSTGSNAQLNFRAHDFILLTGQINADSGISDFRIDTTLQCCPPAANRPVFGEHITEERMMGTSQLKPSDSDSGIPSSQITDLFPNPFQNRLTLVTAQPGWFEVQLRDLQGHLLIESRLDQGCRLILDTTHLAPGMYFCLVSSPAGSFSRKILKLDK